MEPEDSWLAACYKLPSWRGPALGYRMAVSWLPGLRRSPAAASRPLPLKTFFPGQTVTGASSCNETVP